MSMDIRSYFSCKNGGSGTRQNNAASQGSKKRTLRVLESYSDDDDDLIIIDRPHQKKPKEAKTESEISPQRKKEKLKETSVSVSSYFGTSPVQQKQQQIKKVEKSKSDGNSDFRWKERSKKKSKKKEKNELNESYDIVSDDGFDDSLVRISDKELELLEVKEKLKSEKFKVEEENKETVENVVIQKSPAKKAGLKKTPVKDVSSSVKTVRTPSSADSKTGKNPILDSDHKRRNAESYQRYLNRGGPKHPGSKEIPEGTPTCLQGLTFVISGVLDSLEREEAVDLIQKCGGRTTSSISRKTNFIVVGDDAGVSKLEKAKQFGTKKLTEDELLDLIRAKSSVDDESGSSQDNFIEGTPKKNTNVNLKGESRVAKQLKNENSPNNNHKKTRKILDAEPSINEEKRKAKKRKLEEELKSSSAYESITDSQEYLQESGSDTTTNAEVSLWVDKYKPQSTKQIIGQSGEKSNVKKLIYWLENWKKNNIFSKEKKSRPAPWQSQDGSAFKAVLLSGPPGVGKTTSVHLVCKELGMDMIEFNASDTRSKRLLQEDVSELLTTKSLRRFCQGDKADANHVLVMDEVDGMAGNEDRGGIQELIQVIKRTKVPIICMCNDRSHPKIRSLVNYCYDLRFNKPRVEQIKGAMMSVCFKEQLKISSEGLEEIIINANQDIRQVLHNLSLWGVRNKSINTDQAKKDSAKAKKPLNLGPWDVARKVFSASEHSSMTFKEKEELFFQDYSLGPLFIQDTYLRVKPYKAKNDKIATLNLVSQAADALLVGDVIEGTIRSQNAWGLLPVQAVFSSVLPGHLMEGHIQGQIQFPVWLGKNSKRNKFDRLLQELQTHMRLSISGSKEAVNLDYLQVLRDSITRPLLRYGIDGVSDTLKLMRDYNLTKDDVDNIMELSLWSGQKDPFTSIDSKVKAALTRAYNKEGKTVPYAVTSNTKIKTADNDYMLEEEAEVEGEVTEDVDELELDAMIKKGKPKTRPEKEDNEGKTKKKKERKKK